VVLVARARAATSAPAVSWRQPTDIRLSPILTGALEAFYENGFHGTSVRDIARRVGFTVPALYYHHENKEAVLMALLDLSIDHVSALCDAAVLDGGDDPEARFCNLVEALVLFETTSAKTAFLDREIRVLGPTNRAAYAEKRSHIQDLLVGAIADGVQAGIFDVSSPPDTARALLGMVQAIATWFRPDGPQTPQQIAMQYLEIAARSVGADPAVLGRITGRQQS
jgi:AcrR family transcriptional regulator